MAKVTLTPLDMKFVNVFGAAAASFRKKMQQLLLIATAGGEAGREANRILQAEANKASKVMELASRSWTTKRIPQAYREGAVQFTKLPYLSSPGPNLVFGGVNTALLNRLMLETITDLVSASEGPQRLYGSGLRIGQALMTNEIAEQISVDQKLTESMVRGVLEREAPRQLRDRMMKDLGLDRGDIIQLENGQRWDARSYTGLLARTRGLEALNQAALQTLRDKGYNFIKTSEHDGVDEKDICFELQGKVWALGPNDLGIPELPKEFGINGDGMPPWHPNCAHTFAPWNPDLKTNIEVEQAVKAQEGSQERIKNYQ